MNLFLNLKKKNKLLFRGTNKKKKSREVVPRNYFRERRDARYRSEACILSGQRNWEWMGDGSSTPRLCSNLNQRLLK